MLDASSAGRGTQPRSKTINVEANLMAQRLIERRSVLDGNRRRVVILAAILFSGLLSLPAIFAWMISANAAAISSSAREAQISSRLSELKKRQDTARPAIQESQLLGVVDSRANAYLGRVIQFLNCVEPDMALSSMKVEVTAGQMKITATAEAEDYDAYRRFVARCQEAVGMDNVFPRSVKARSLLGQKGVVFDIEHKARVGQ